METEVMKNLLANSQENTLWPDFNQFGCNKVFENDTHLAFVNEKERVIISFIKDRNYAFNAFRVIDDENVEVLMLDIPELQVVVDFLKSINILH